MISGLLSAVQRRLPAGGLGRHISWVMLQSGLETFTMTVAGLLVARWFGEVLLGQLMVILAGVQLITMMADGLYAGIVRQVSGARVEDPVKALKVGWLLIWTTIGLAVLASGVLIGAVLLSQHRYAVVSWLFFAACITVGRVARTSFEAAFRSMGEFRIPALVGGVTIGSGAVIITILAAAGMRVTMYLAVQAAVLAVNSIIIGWLYRRRSRQAGVQESGDLLVRGKPDPRVELIKYTFPLVMRGAVAFLYLKVNIWLILAMASDGDAGQFGFFDRVVTLPRLLMSACLAAFAPRVVPALGNRMNLSILTGRIQGIMLMMSVPFSILFLLSPWLILPFFPQYGPACTMLQIYAPVLPLTGLAFAGSVLLMQGGFPKVVMWLSIWASVGNIVLVYLTLRFSGVLESMVMMSFVHAASAGAFILMTYRLLDIRFKIRVL